ncbi:MAG: tRNA adenosine(34) deaminase TadA [Phycisphaerales bacterium]|jgi:tRNA(adenine34) deaminase|nr:tRNA adenosine(34) deaminase TadA [Phycisphaerales bacterium]
MSSSSRAGHPGRRNGGKGHRCLQRHNQQLAQHRLHHARDERIEPFDICMMERAIVLARQAAATGEVPVGAVVYRGEEILAEASNNREASSDPTGHAEMVALRIAGRNIEAWRLQGCSVAVTLEPCPMCAGAMVNGRVGRLVYGASDPKAGACDTLYEITTDPRLNHRLETIGGVLADRCAGLLSDFFRKRRAERKKARARRSG